MLKSNLCFTLILGTRPEIIKLFPVIKYLKRKGYEFETIHTGQHYSKELKHQIEKDVKLPKWNKEITLKEKQSAASLGEMVTSISRYLANKKTKYKRLIIVQGDTNSTLAGALVANKLKIPLVHIEAGFRSGLKTQPEEINRILVDHMSDVNFAVNAEALQNLKNERLQKNSFLTSNTAYAAAAYMEQEIKNSVKVINLVNYRLMTIHRAENADHAERLHGIYDLANLLAEDTKVLWVLHPRTWPKLEKILEKKIKTHTLSQIKESPGLYFIAPQGFREFFLLMLHCKSIYSDSGGIVDEAAYLSKPYICLRSETEQHEFIAKKRMLLLPPTQDAAKMKLHSVAFEQKRYPSLSKIELRKKVLVVEKIIKKIQEIFN